MQSLVRLLVHLMNILPTNTVGHRFRRVIAAQLLVNLAPSHTIPMDFKRLGNEDVICI